MATATRGAPPSCALLCVASHSIQKDVGSLEIPKDDLSPGALMKVRQPLGCPQRHIDALLPRQGRGFLCQARSPEDATDDTTGRHSLQKVAKGPQTPQRRVMG